MSATIASRRPTLLQRSFSARETESSSPFGDLLAETILPSTKSFRQHRRRSMIGRSGMDKIITKQRSHSFESEPNNLGLDSDSDTSSTWSCGGSVSSEPRLERSDSSSSGRSIIVETLVGEISSTSVAGEFALETLSKLAKHKRSHHVRQVLSHTPSHIKSLVEILKEGSRLERGLSLDILWGLSGGRHSAVALKTMSEAGALKHTVGFALDIIDTPVGEGPALGKRLGEVVGLLRCLVMHHERDPADDHRMDYDRIGTLLRRVFVGGEQDAAFSGKIKEKAAGLLWIVVMKANVAEGLPCSVLACIPSLLDLLESTSPTAKESATGALWSLATHPIGKQMILGNDGLRVLLETLETGSPAAKDSAAGALLHLKHRA